MLLEDTSVDVKMQVDPSKLQQLNARNKTVERSLSNLALPAAEITKECSDVLSKALNSASLPKAYSVNFEAVLAAGNAIEANLPLSEEQQTMLTETTDKIRSKPQGVKYRRISGIEMKKEDWVLKYNDFAEQKGELPPTLKALAKSTEIDLTQVKKGMNILRHHMAEKEPRVISLKPTDLLCVETKPDPRVQLCCFPGGCDKKCTESRHRMLCERHSAVVRAIISSSLGEIMPPHEFTNLTDLESVHADLYGPVLYKINQVLLIFENFSQPGAQQLHGVFKTLKACIIVYRQYLNPWIEIAMGFVKLANWLLDYIDLIIEAITYMGSIVVALWNLVQPFIAALAPWLQTVMTIIFSCFSISVFGVPIGSIVVTLLTVGLASILALVVSLLVRFFRWVSGTPPPPRPPPQVVNIDGDDVQFFTPADMA